MMFEAASLGDIAEVTKLAGFEFTKYIEYNETGEIIALRALNLRNGVLDLTDIKRIDRSVSEKLPRSKLYENDILLTYTGNGYGDCAIVEENDKYHLAPNICKIAPNSGKINPYYLYSVIRSDYFYQQMTNYIGGSSQPTIPMKTIRILQIPYPPLEIQNQIASILSILNRKIAVNTAINDNLEQQTQAIFKSWFVDFEPFGGVMPDDWYIGNVSDLAKEIICGKTPSTKKKEYYSDYMPFITIPDMHNCVYAISTERYLSELGAKSQEKKTIHKNSICVSCIGTAGLVVLAAVDSQTNQQINSIVPKDTCSPYYIYLLMQTMSEKIKRLGQSGSTIVNLNKTQFGIMEALVPSIASMNEFDSLVQPLFEKILANQQENQRLSKLRDSLLPKLMNGAIDVSAVKI